MSEPRNAVLPSTGGASLDVAFSERPPIFIVGCGRSGTTLLRLMLNAHPDLAIPLESQFMYHLARRRARGFWPATLGAAADCERFVTFLERHPTMKHWEISFGALRDRLNLLPEKSHAAVFRAVFTEYMNQERKKQWGDKTPMHVQYMLLLDQLIPGAKYIHVIRDGRDVALSLLTRSWGPRYLWHAGWYWKWLVLSGMVAGRILGPDRYVEVRYEDLVLRAEQTLRSLCGFLEIAFMPALLEYYKTDAAAEYARKGTAVSKRVTTPPDESRVSQWVQRMSVSGRKSMHRQAGALLAFLDYEVDKLSDRQRRELDSIRGLMEPAVIARLRESAVQRRGADTWLRIALVVDSTRQLSNFFLKRYEAWARTGITWQRTVAGMLR